MLEGVLIIVAALVILRKSYYGILAPTPLEAPALGLAINVAAGVLNSIWCWVLISRGRHHQSPALVADGKHLLADVITSAGVVLGVLLAVATGYAILDPILAALVALNILWSGWKLMTSSLSGLMDEAVSQDLMRVIRETIADRAEGAIEAHDLRTRQAGSATFIDFHLVVDGATSVSEAHQICDRIETALKAKLTEAQITIHVEPDNKAKHAGILVL